MKIVSLYLFCLFGISIFAQKNEVLNDTIIYNSSAVQIEPLFPGGIKEFYRYLGENYSLPNNKEFKGGKVFTSFVIEKDGSISNIKILRDCGFETGIETIRILKGSPLWIPAELNGHKVRVQYSLPINLQPPPIEEEVDDKKIYNSKEVEIKPDFQGGIAKFYTFIRDNYRAPNHSGLNGKVLVSFIIEVDGSLTDIKVLMDNIGYGASEEAVRVFKLSPKWSPAKLDGKSVRCIYNIPIHIETPN